MAVPPRRGAHHLGSTRDTHTNILRTWTYAHCFEPLPQVCSLATDATQLDSVSCHNLAVLVDLPFEQHASPGRTCLAVQQGDGAQQHSPSLNPLHCSRPAVLVKQPTSHSSALNICDVGPSQHACPPGADQLRQSVTNESTRSRLVQPEHHSSLFCDIADVVRQVL